MDKVYIVLQESNCDGQILIEVTPCADLETAKKTMQDEINTLLTESNKYSAFYLSCNYDDYYEHISIMEKEIVKMG